MLTLEGIRERKWGPYPKLRQVLQDKEMPADFYGLTSVSDNRWDQIHRLIEIATLVDEYRADIKNAMPTLGHDELCRDLHDIQHELEWASNYFREMGQRVQSVIINDLR